MIYKLNSVVPFGKYKGLTIKKIVDESLQSFKTQNYLRWCIHNVKGFKLSPKAKSYYLKQEKKMIDSYPDITDYYPGDYGQSSCPGDYMGMCPEDYGIFPWGNS